MSEQQRAVLLVLLASLLVTGCGAAAPTTTSLPATATQAALGPASTPLPPSATPAVPAATVVPPTPTETPLPAPTATRLPPTAIPSPAPAPAPVVLLETSPQLFGYTETFQVGLGDLDGDGDLDAVFANMAANDSQVWVNDGQGTFQDSGQRLTRQGHGLDLGDLDGDGDLDIFMTCAHYGASQKPSRVYLNDGQGTFQDSGQDLGDQQLSGNGVNLVDVDGDGDLDAHVIYYEVGGMADRVYLNDGAGRFSDSGLALEEEEIAWGDLDGDGDLDMLAKAYGEGYWVRLNDGAGRFTTGWQVADSQAMYGDLALADFDGDGDLDALIANGFRSEGSLPTRLFWNDGGAQGGTPGQFTASSQKLNETLAARFAVGDLDRDGDLDVLVSNMDWPGEVWLNDGAGGFADSGLRLESPSRHLATWPSLGDLDGDGDLDLVEAGFEGRAEVWLNGTTPPAGEGGGGLIAFASNQDGDWEIFVIDLVDGALQQLTHNAADDLSPSWSPDGAQIAFVSNRDGNDEIYTMRVDGSDQRRLTETDASESFPAWSPDGTEISFDSDRDGNWEIYVMDVDGIKVRRLTNDPADDWITSWSPDGGRIVFESRRDGNYEIYVTDAGVAGQGSGNQQRLTDDRAHDGFPAWSPDGTQIAFMSQRDGNYEIYVMDADGTNPRRVTDHRAEDSDPAWSPDAEWLAFVSQRDGNDEIYVVKADGGGLRRLTGDGAQNWGPAWQPHGAKSGTTGTWIRTFEGAGYGAFFDMVLDEGGNALAVGATNHLHMPPYSGDALLMKLTLGGDVLWEKTWGGDGYEQAWSVALAQDGGYYVFGETDSYGAGDRDLLLLKVAEDGGEDWFRTYGGSGREWPFGMLRLSNGELLIYGFTELGTGGDRDQYALRLGPDGEVIWEYTVETPGEELVAGALETGDGDLVLAVIVEEDGQLVKLDADGHVLWTKRYELPGWQYASQVAGTSDGGFLLAGFSMSSSPRRQADTWLARCNAAGHLEWEKSFGDPDQDDYGTSLIRLEDGTYLIGGIGNGILLSRVDPDGNLLWRRSLVGESVYGSEGLVALEDGGYLVAGFLQIVNGRSYDAVVLRTDAGGWVGSSESPAPAATAMPVESPTPARQPQAGATQVREKDGSVMVYVPAGRFDMGSDDGDLDYAMQLCSEFGADCRRPLFEDEQPVHTVALDAFWIDKYEVTNAQYQECVAAGACQAPLTCDWGEPTYGDAGKAGHPVACVDWQGAHDYCAWAGGRLPTEAEWEYAARGPAGNRFPWGDAYDGTLGNSCDVNCTLAWNYAGYDDGYEQAAPVGSYPGGASWCGAEDMAGNVWEWVNDWYDPDYYAGSPVENPGGPSSGEYRVSRGGSWRDGSNGELHLSAMRYYSGVPSLRTSNVGVRCASAAGSP